MPIGMQRRDIAVGRIFKLREVREDLPPERNSACEESAGQRLLTRIERT